MAEDSDSWKLRRQESNRHDEFQRSLEELKDMMRTLLIMETGSSSFVRSVPIKGILESPHVESICDSIEVGAKMGCPFEEPRNRFRPAPIDLEISLLMARNTNPTPPIAPIPVPVSPPIPPHRRHEIPQEQEFNKLQQEEVLDVVEESPDFQPVVVDGTDERQSASLLFEPQKLESPPQKQQEESSRHIEELQGSIVQKSKKLEVDVSGSSHQNKRIPVPLNQGICLNLGAQSNEFEDISASVTPTDNQNSPPRLAPERIVPESSSTKTKATVTKRAEGNGINSSLELAEWEDFLVLDDSLSVKNLDLPVESLDFGGAHKVFEKLSGHDVFRQESNLFSRDVESSPVMDLVVAKHRLWAENVVFDPGIVDRHEFIHGDFTVFVLVLIGTEINVGVLLSLNHSNWVFDPGGAFALLANGPKLLSNGVKATRVAEVASIREHFTDVDCGSCCCWLPIGKLGTNAICC